MRISTSKKSNAPSQDLDGWGPGAQAWWEIPCAHT